VSAPTDGNVIPGATAVDLDGKRLTAVELQAEMPAFADTAT
jgi:hypothetical protein